MANTINAGIACGQLLPMFAFALSQLGEVAGEEGEKEEQGEDGDGDGGDEGVEGDEGFSFRQSLTLAVVEP